MPDKISKLPGAKFLLDSGLLFEINRSILHPFGLAIEVIIDDSIPVTESLGLDEEPVVKDPIIRIGDVWDFRTEPGGMQFADESYAEGLIKFTKFMQEFGSAKLAQRKQLLGYIKQPAPIVTPSTSQPIVSTISSPVTNLIIPNSSQTEPSTIIVPRADGKRHKFIAASNTPISELEENLHKAGVNSPVVDVFKKAAKLELEDARAEKIKEKYLEEGIHKRQDGRGMCKDPVPIEAKIPRGGTTVFCSSCGYIYRDTDLET
jgi:hypothetical protein